MRFLPQGLRALFRRAGTETPAQDSLDPAVQQSRLRARLDRLVGRARVTLAIEQLWPRLWLPLAVIAAFLTLAWLGLFQQIPPLARIAIVAVSALALLAAFVPAGFTLARILRERSDRKAALARLERDSRLEHGPARTIDDNLALGGRDPASMVLWEIHRKRAAAALAGMRLDAPDPAMPRRDRYALRALPVLAVAASAFVAGPEIGARLGAAFDWSVPAPEAAAIRIDGWVDPPGYTGMAPLMLDFQRDVQHLRVPEDSVIVIRMAGADTPRIAPVTGLDALDGSGREAGAGLTEQRFRIHGDAQLELGPESAPDHRLSITAIPDLPPEIEFVDSPEVQSRGAFTLTYMMQDDYGVADARGIVALPPERDAHAPLVPPPELPLSLSRSGEDDIASTNFDRTEHPWAGARVTLQLEARDDAGQAGYSDVIDFTLPQRPFNDPLARALVEQRRNLVLNPAQRDRVLGALDALAIAPERFEIAWGVWLGLRSATSRLAQARSDEDLIDVADWLWAMALDIEDGGLSDAEQALRAAQERLQQAMDEGASEEELAQLMEELREAMDAFMQELARRMMENEDSAEAPRMPSGEQQMITQQDLQDMMDAMQEAMRNGDMAEAQRLMDELRNIMQNLQTAQRGDMYSDPHTRELNRQFDELDAITREQQQLRDDTFGDAQRQRRGEQAEGDGQQGEGEGRQEGEGPGDLTEQQQALRDRLQELQERMRELGMQGEQGLDDAEGAMGDAEGALGEGRPDDAVDAQGRALEGLQQGLQGMAEQMQQMFGEGQGEGGGQPGEMRGEGGNGQMGRMDGREGRDTDPLGRPTRDRGRFESDVRVPGADESPARRARRILEELRDRLADPGLPGEERDYFERLLRRD
ncbi:MAG: TIGR02302 family protein [Salinarimonas sp.]|nr:TIGR02302 family protein [Salinarimonas sp.]